jgi:hypothetical protein
VPTFVATQSGLVAESDAFFAAHDVWLLLVSNMTIDDTTTLADVVANEVTAIARVQVNDKTTPITAAYDATDARSETVAASAEVSNNSGSSAAYRAVCLAIDANGTSGNTTGTLWRVVVEDNDQTLPDGTSRTFDFQLAVNDTTF